MVIHQIKNKLIQRTFHLLCWNTKYVFPKKSDNVGPIQTFPLAEHQKYELGREATNNRLLLQTAGAEDPRTVSNQSYQRAQSDVIIWPAKGFAKRLIYFSRHQQTEPSLFPFVFYYLLQNSKLINCFSLFIQKQQYRPILQWARDMHEVSNKVITWGRVQMPVKWM